MIDDIEPSTAILYLIYSTGSTKFSDPSTLKNGFIAIILKTPFGTPSTTTPLIPENRVHLPIPTNKNKNI